MIINRGEVNLLADNVFAYTGQTNTAMGTTLIP
jgi:hypothetical protein